MAALAIVAAGALLAAPPRPLPGPAE
jgi:hypothetical protein